MVCCLRPFEHGMVAYSVTSSISGTIQSDLEPPLFMHSSRGTAKCEWRVQKMECQVRLNGTQMPEATLEVIIPC